MIEKLFKLKVAGSSVRQEVIAGITTFLTMSYIIFVNPDILSATGMDKGALITATILAAAFGTALVGLWGNVPFAMAPGMGLNAFFAYTLVIGGKINWQTALGVVFLSGVVFVILTFLGVRRWIVEAIPIHLRLATAAGIGLFITFIGCKNLGLIVDNPATLVSLGKFTPAVLCGLLGIAIIGILEVRRVKGAILIGIVATTLAGMALDLAGMGFGLVQIPKEIISTPPSIAPIFLELDIMGALKWSLWGAIFSFMFVDLFDSIGTIVACSYEAGMVEKDGKIKKIDRILSADAIATLVGSLLGTSTTTTYIESGSGIAEGGKTGLANMVTALLFLIVLLFSPLIAIVPGFATAPALVVVGIFMFKNVGEIDFKKLEYAIPSFFTIILMPLTYSISMGLCVGFISHILIYLAAGKAKDVHPMMWAIGALSVWQLTLSGH